MAAARIGVCSCIPGGQGAAGGLPLTTAGLWQLAMLGRCVLREEPPSSPSQGQGACAAVLAFSPVTVALLSCGNGTAELTESRALGFVKPQTG